VAGVRVRTGAAAVERGAIEGVTAVRVVLMANS
jgi:hypothetical protein